jgi:hypothetical protein
MITTIIIVICVLAAVGVLCWFISTLTMPPMIKNLLWAVLALLCIVVIYNFAVSGGNVPNLR